MVESSTETDLSSIVCSYSEEIIQKLDQIVDSSSQTVAGQLDELQSNLSDNHEQIGELRQIMEEQDDLCDNLLTEFEKLDAIYEKIDKYEEFINEVELKLKEAELAVRRAENDLNPFCISLVDHSKLQRFANRLLRKPNLPRSKPLSKPQFIPLSIPRASDYFTIVSNENHSDSD